MKSEIEKLSPPCANLTLLLENIIYGSFLERTSAVHTTSTLLRWNITSYMSVEDLMNIGIQEETQ